MLYKLKEITKLLALWVIVDIPCAIWFSIFEPEN